MQRTFVIGFVGGIGSGKSVRCRYVSALFPYPNQWRRSPALALSCCEPPPPPDPSSDDSEATARHRDDLRRTRGGAATATPLLTSCVRIDCDTVAHRLYQPGTRVYNQLVEHFGTQIIRRHAEGGHAARTIDRRVLGAQVFGDPKKKKLEELNRIVWPAINTTVGEALDEAAALDTSFVLVEGAVLLDMPILADRCDLILLYHACPSVVVQRVRQRDPGLKDADILRRIGAQKTVAELLAASAALPSRPSVVTLDTSAETVLSGCASTVEAIGSSFR